jgi:dCMP deaminase
MADQKTLDRLFMDVAFKFAELSTCKRLKVGAIITKNNRIISSGYNGTPTGFAHCEDVHTDIEFDNAENSKLHHIFSEQFETHAEMNALLDMAKRGLSPEGATLYTTICPCKHCAKLVIAAGIKRVVFADYYDRDKKSVIDGPMYTKIDYHQEYNGSDIIKIVSNDKSSVKIEQLKGDN